MPRYASKCAIVAALTTVFIGYNIGVMSGNVVHFNDSKISRRQLDILTWIFHVLSFVGLITAAWTSDRIGRRYSIALAMAIYFAGRLLMVSARSYAILLLGRLCASVGVGFAHMVTPIYIGEVVSASSRGELTLYPEVFFNAGTLLGYLSNYGLPKLHIKIGRRAMLALGGISSCLLSIAVHTMPESPRWLVMRNRLDDAKRVLDMISDSNEESALRLAEIMKAAGITKESNDSVVQVTQQKAGKTLWQDLLHPSQPVRQILLFAVGMHLFRQTCGIDTILQSPQIFDRARITDPDIKILTLTIVDSIKVGCMLFATYLIDRIGRRPLMLCSIGGMFSSLASLGVLIAIVDNGIKVKWVVTMCIVIIFLFALFYLISFSIGLGPITSMYASEIFPLRLRSQGSAIGFALDQAASGASSMIFSWLCEKLSFGGTAFLFATVAGIMWALFYATMPETRGLNLEEIGCLLENYTKRESAGREKEIGRINGVEGDATVSRPS